MEYLDRAIQSLKNGKEPDLDISPFNVTEIDLQISALIPSQYLNDINTRLIFYKRMANAKNKAIFMNWKKK